MAKHAAKTPSESSKSSENSADLAHASHAGSATTDANDERIGLTEAFAPVDAQEVSDTPELLLVSEVPEEPKGRHSKKTKPNVPAYMRKSRRMRRVLIVVVVLLIALIGALGYLTWRLVAESQMLATQQTQEQQDAQEVDAIQQKETKDAPTETAKKTTVPNLVSVLGLTQDEAVTVLAHGAQVTSVKEVNEEDNPIKQNVTVALTDEPADTRTGTPTVYLGLDEEGVVIQVGYSASAAALGYGTLSFVDAVKNEHVVEKTLQEAGIAVEEGAAVLPEDKAEYSTYATDGTTLMKENCSFSGSIDINDAPHEWSAVLSYDYTTANMSGNLAETIRIIYVYINA